MTNCSFIRNVNISSHLLSQITTLKNISLAIYDYYKKDKVFLVIDTGSVNIDEEYAKELGQQ